MTPSRRSPSGTSPPNVLTVKVRGRSWKLGISGPLLPNGDFRYWFVPNG